MSLKGVWKTAQKFATDHSPGILTSLGVAGVVTTAVLTGRATLNATRILGAESWVREDENDSYTQRLIPNKEILQLIWREFIPPAVVGTVTIVAVISANNIGTRRAAAIAAAFKISEDLASEYRAKVLDTLGIKKEEEVRVEVAKDRMEKNPPPNTIIISGSNTLFFDMYSGRYFESDVESVRKAMNDTNAQINSNYYACLTDLYHRLGLDQTEYSDTLGWNSDELLAFNFTAVLGPKDKPAIAIEFNKIPIQHYDRVA